MVGLTTETYVPKLRSKYGEQIGYGHLSPAARTHTQVQWVIPARSQKDVEEQRYLNADEYVRLNGKRIGLVSYGQLASPTPNTRFEAFQKRTWKNQLLRCFTASAKRPGMPLPWSI